MIQSFAFPDLFRLSDGHYMVNRITDEMISVMWARMSRLQKEEFELLYGEDEAFECFKGEIRHSEHQAAFFNGSEITCLMWSDWADVKGVGEHLRTLGCVCSDWAFKHPLNFCKHSCEVRDAFMLMEPPEVKEIYVFITKHFSQSRKWAAKICGCKELIEVRGGKGNGSFMMYRYRIGEDKQ